MSEVYADSIQAKVNGTAQAVPLRDSDAQEKIGSLSEEIVNLQNINLNGNGALSKKNFKIGNFNSATPTTLITDDNYYPIESLKYITVSNDGYSVREYCYTEDRSLISYLTYEKGTNLYEPPKNTKYFRLMAYYGNFEQVTNIKAITDSFDIGVYQSSFLLVTNTANLLTNTKENLQSWNFDGLGNLLKNKFVIGNFDGESAENLITDSNYYPIELLKRITVADGYKVVEYCYNKNREKLGVLNYTNGSFLYAPPSGTVYFRLLAFHGNYLNISNINDVLNNFEIEMWQRSYKSVIDLDSVSSKKNQYSDKKFCFEGDSLTAGGSGGIYTYATCKYFGITNYVNTAVGGTSMEGQKTGNAGAIVSDDRVNKIPIDSNYIVIMCGTNGDGELGELNLNNSDINTFIGAFNVWLSKIYYKFKQSTGYYSEIDYSNIIQSDEPIDIQIILITPPQGYGVDINSVDGLQNKLKKRGDSMLEMARLWGVPCLDSMKTMEMNIFNCANYYGDKTHFGQRSHYKLANGLIGLMMANRPNENIYGNLQA